MAFWHACGLIGLNLKLPFVIGRPGARVFPFHEFGSGRASPTGNWTQTEDSASDFWPIFYKNIRGVWRDFLLPANRVLPGGNARPLRIFASLVQGNPYVNPERHPHNFHHHLDVGQR